MIDENGNEMSDKEILKSALDHLAEACCFLYEIEDESFHSLGFMVDSCLKLGTVLLNDGNVLNAAADYSAYEQELFEKNKLRVIK